MLMFSSALAYCLMLVDSFRCSTHRQNSTEAVGDTWHKTIEEAKKRAIAEYEGLNRDWQEIPDGVDMNVFADALRPKLKEHS